MHRTKIVVLHMKEVIYTLIFAALALILFIVLVAMFQKGKEPEDVALYKPGIYTSAITLGEAVIDVEVIVDADRINGIGIKNLSHEVATLYPLVQPCLDVISQQIYQKQSIEGITYDESGTYTSELLLKAIEEALEKAKDKK